ncbi:MAG: lysophospholipase [Chloroflexi bacterium]|jgi:pimeloyl-ACP methyl ester carboxylesterase|nr:lysophospholipase [Chloroflexota bacterium]
MRRRLVAVTALLAVPVAAAASAARFGVLYRERAGFPTRAPVTMDPGDAGLPWMPVTIPSGGREMPGWFIPAGPSGAADVPRPGVVLVHGWGSNRGRMLPIAAFLRAAGFHTLAFDVRGHGDGPPESLPVTAVEFGDDAAAAVGVLRALPGVGSVAILGHSMGGVGASLAAAARDDMAALVMVSAPADPRLLVRETFRMADLPLPGPVAHPLAWVALRSTLRPRGHRPPAASARRAVARYPGPVLLVQGDADELVPLRDLRMLERAAASRPPGARTEVLVVPGGRHRWLYEDATFRRTVAAFLAESSDGMDPEAAAAAAGSTPAVRPPDTEGPLVPAGLTSRPPRGRGGRRGPVRRPGDVPPPSAARNRAEP